MKYTKEELEYKPEDLTDYSNSLYLNKKNIKGAGTTTEFTPELLKEYIRCKEDVEYFARKYVKIINLDRGLEHIVPYDYQTKMWENFTNERFNIVLACRQSGKSVGYVVWILHYAIFNPDQTIAILANKGATSKEILKRVSLALENLPFFLQPGCKAFNKTFLEFDTNTTIFAESTSSDSIRGRSVNVLVLDEFAFVDNDKEFMTSTYPVVTSGTSTKIIIVSTPNGVGNEYHRIYSKAQSGKNNFIASRVDWWDVTGRDEEWKKSIITDIGEFKFRQEYGNQFIGSAKTLIDPDILSQLQDNGEVPIYDKSDVKIYEKPQEGSFYVMTVDVGKGRGQDYSTFNIMKADSIPYEQVATYRNNLISPLIFPTIIYKWAKLYNDAFLIVENNDHGIVVANYLYYDYEYDNMYTESTVKSGGIGLSMNKKIKAIGCSNLKDFVDEGKMIVKDEETIYELITFEAKNNSFEASRGNHDDMVMPLVSFSWFCDTNIFQEYSKDQESLREILYKEKILALEKQKLQGFFFSNTDDYNNYTPQQETLYGSNPLI